MEAKDLDNFAIVVRPETDNVAVVTVDLIEAGTRLRYNGDILTVSGRALRGQSLAVSPVKKGAPIVTLGDPFGLASRPIRAGDPIDDTNLNRRLPKYKVPYRDN